jgi:DNA polymerase I
MLLIDGSGLIFRAFYSITPMTTPDGTPINAVFGLVRLLLKIFRDIPATASAVAFDAGRTTFRTEKFPAYKGNRIEPPPELRPQFQLSIDTARAAQAPVYVEQGLEADDLIATLCATAVKRGMAVSILTGDNDLLQLLDQTEYAERVEVILPQKFGETRTVSLAGFTEQFGFPVQRFVDYKALRGDTSDNIPGVMGIGEKTAAKLVSTYGKLEQLYGNIELVKPDGVRAKLKAAKDEVFLYRELVTLKRDCEIAYDFEQRTLPNFAAPELQLLLERFGFNRVREDAAKAGDLQANAD